MLAVISSDSSASALQCTLWKDVPKSPHSAVVPADSSKAVLVVQDFCFQLLCLSKVELWNKMRNLFLVL